MRWEQSLTLFSNNERLWEWMSCHYNVPPACGCLLNTNTGTTVILHLLNAPIEHSHTGNLHEWKGCGRGVAMARIVSWFVVEAGFLPWHWELHPKIEPLWWQSLVLDLCLDIVKCISRFNVWGDNHLSWILALTLSMASKDSTSRVIILCLGFLPWHCQLHPKIQPLGW